MHLGSSCLSDRGKRGDESRSNSVVIKQTVLYPTRLERDECSDLPVRAAPQSHGRKSVVRGLPLLTSVYFSPIHLDTVLSI